MAYFREFVTNWRPLAAGTVGIAVGYGINNYLNNLFIPSLMSEFGWSNSDIALLGVAAVLSVIVQPIAGRITDRFGVRWVAIFGVSFATLIYLALSLMSGSLWIFFLLNAAQIAFVGATTGPVVYSRLIAETYDRARGVALAIAVSAPSILGVLIVPTLSAFIDREGWRAGYILAAAGAAAFGTIAILLIPVRPKPVPTIRSLDRSGGSDLKDVIRNPAFRLIVSGMLLCSLTIVMQTTQMKVILLDAGLSSSEAAGIIAVYAAGVIVGRLLCGMALDRFPPHAVASIALGLPAVGLFILALGVSDELILTVAVLFLGLSLGAEGDLGGFLAMTYFRVEVYSTVVGFFVGAIAVSSSLGSLLLSSTISLTGSFSPFLAFAALSALSGSTLLWRLGSIGGGNRARRSSASDPA